MTQGVYGIYENEDITNTRNSNTVTDEVYTAVRSVVDNVYGNNKKSMLIRLKKTTDSAAFTTTKLSKKKSKKLKNTNTLVVDLTSTEINNMQADKEVAFIEVDSPVEAVSKGEIIPFDKK